jgi:hypothetical protein
MKNMKRFVWIASLLLFSCAGEKKEYHKAENALDAGREYIQACLEGDFSRAKFYTIADAADETQLALTEKAYREKDKEGRQQLRTASIIINEVKELSDSVTLISYRYSFNKTADSLKIVKRNGDWLVNTVLK